MPTKKTKEKLVKGPRGGYKPAARRNQQTGEYMLKAGLVPKRGTGLYPGGKIRWED